MPFWILGQASPINLDPKIGVEWIIGGLVVMVMNFMAVKLGNQETQRLVKALHGRFDDLEAKQHAQAVEHARLDERQKHDRAVIQELKRSQRFKLPED
jgi:hypothetical protein